MLTGLGVRCRSGRKIKMEIPASLFRTAGQQADHLEFRVKEGQTVCR
jgi:hypothetical protein